MWRNPKAVFHKKPNYKKLLQYGFKKQAAGFTYAIDIMEGMFTFHIYISDDGIMELEVRDTSTNDEYTLVYITTSTGPFVGDVRSECDEIINDIVNSCYEPDIFKSEYAKLIIRYMHEKYDAEPEYLWKESSNNAVFRDTKTRKWFAVLLTVEKRKLGIDEDGEIEVIDLKAKPEDIVSLVDGIRYHAGYHMNKKHWYTICLYKSVPIEQIFKLIDNSYSSLMKTNKCL